MPPAHQDPIQPTEQRRRAAAALWPASQRRREAQSTRRMEGHAKVRSGSRVITRPDDASALFHRLTDTTEDRLLRSRVIVVISARHKWLLWRTTRDPRICSDGWVDSIPRLAGGKERLVTGKPKEPFSAMADGRGRVRLAWPPEGRSPPPPLTRAPTS